MLRNFKLSVALAAVILLTSGCLQSYVDKFERTTGIELSDDEEKTLVDLPDFMLDQCLWIQLDLQERGVNQETIDAGLRLGQREGKCCPNTTGGDVMNEVCEQQGKTRAYRFDSSDSGTFQFNGFRPGGGLKPGSPAIEFCRDGVRRFLNGEWTDVRTYPCDQWMVIADHSLQIDMFIDFIDKCGIAPWTKLANGRYARCNSAYDPFA